MITKFECATFWVIKNTCATRINTPNQLIGAEKGYIRGSIVDFYQNRNEARIYKTLSQKSFTGVLGDGILYVTGRIRQFGCCHLFVTFFVIL